MPAFDKAMALALRRPHRPLHYSRPFPAGGQRFTKFSLMYNPKSRRADEFINREEIEATLKWAEEHKSDRPLIESLIDKARTAKGLTHREAAVLLFAILKTAMNASFQSPVKSRKNLRQPHRSLCAALPLQSLREYLHLLPVSR